MLNLEALNVFLSIAEHGSFSEAGRQIHKSQPALSQIIQGLEKQLGTQLFVRQGRTLQLTEPGQVFVPMARELIAASQRIEETMLSLQGEVIGDITFGCSTASGKYLLPGIIAQFRKKFPKVRINVVINSRDSVIKKLATGEVTIGVTSKQIQQPDLEYQEFFEDSVTLIVPANHRWAQFRKIHPDDLLDEPIILREEAAGTREVLLEGLRQHDISPNMLNISMVLGNTEAIEIAVEEGLGIAFVSRLAAARGLALGRVVEVEVEGMNLSRLIYITRDRRNPLARAHVELWEFIKNNRSIETPPISDQPAALPG